ncbi:DMXL1 [Cordylochernes scorpioides]|uniref:DMXL1 n=1 Tax=Cordylochernes scorpioides TaxID=51811 RepID=A0ABY6KT87_9ARAC|nr:DMXL1 [Cordylochernes scorpioides]
MRSCALRPWRGVLSIGHYQRVCGHRFRINDITCHPVLPLLLTTSHHNLPGQGFTSPGGSTPSSPCCPPHASSGLQGFCSELILWKVEPVGPLSKSGGIMELARINSFKTAAFDNVAWIPTLLPSSTLGGISNSPSACFVASDGEQLRVYQAVIDARTLLAEISSASRKVLKDPSLSGSTSSDLEFPVSNLHEVFNIVSLQSTARPGCIIELDSISHAHHKLFALTELNMSLQGSAPKVKPLRIYPRENHFQGEDPRMADASANYANLPIDRSHANFAAACIADVTPSTSGALAAATNWAEQMEAAESGEDSFTVVKHKRRRRESPNRPVEQRSSGVAASRRTGATPRRRPTAGGAMVVQEIRATRADIADARVQQRFSTEDNCVFVEHCPDFGYTHYLQAVEELVGGAGNVLQVMKMDGHMLVGLSTKALAERLLRDGLEIGHTHLRAFPVKKRAERITVANLPFFVDDAAVIEALKPFGDVSSIAPIRLRAGRYTFTDGRREVFILLKEGFTLEKIPTRVVIRNKGNVLSAFISYGVKCSRCGRQGHRRANCPINPGRASNNGQPQPAPLPPGASSTVSRQQSRPTPAAPALPMEKTPSAPPPVTPAPPLQAPEGPVGPRPADSQHPEPPPARPDLVAPLGPLPAQKTLGPAAPTPDVEMSIVEETFASSTSSAKNATRVDLDAFIEGHPSVSFAETDALGLGREEVLDLLSSRTKAQRKGPLLSPPQCDALVGLIGQILDLRPRAASNLYKVLGQVKAELRITPAVPPTPPLPAPRPAETAPPAPQGKESAPAEVAYPPPLPVKMTDEARKKWLHDLFKELNYKTFLIPLLGWIRPEQIIHAALHSGEERNDILGTHPNQRSILANFLGSIIERARGGDQFTLDQLSEFSMCVYGVQDWQSTQLLQVFQEQLVTGISRRLQDGGVELVGPHLQAVVDLRTASDFQEPFFLVVLEKEDSGQSVLHMWRLVVSSMCSAAGNVQTEQEETEKTSRSNSPTFAEESSAHQPHAQPLKITTTKVCTQALPLPPDVEVVHATPSAGHLSSSNIYPACYAPYLISTACTDGSVRFWYCDVTTSNGNDVYTWLEWEMLLNRKSSEISVPGKSQLFKISFNRVIAAAGQPLYVSSCYSGRMACAYKHGHSFMRPTSDDPNSRYVNLSVAIFECESTGGSEWVLEDTIHLKNIALPQPQLNLTMDWDILVDTSVKNRKTAGALIERLTSQEDYLTENASNLGRMLSVPSYSTLYTLRKAIAEKGNQCMLTQKSLVQLDWVSTEDGSHVLTVTVGSKVIIFTPVSTDIAQANVQAMKASKSSNRPLIKQASSMAAPLLHGDEVRWMKIRTTHLSTADGLPPLPMQISWVRDGIFVVGMDNEMQIFSQWRIPNEEAEVKEQEGVGDGRNLIEKELISRAQESSQLRIPGSMSRTTSATLLASASSASDLHKKSKDSSLPPSNEKDSKSSHDNHVHKVQAMIIMVGRSRRLLLLRTDSLTGLGALPDFGLFEACRLACPVLPQYHPKQLNELLGFGKLRRVKAILSHLVRCLAGTENIKKTFLQVPEESKDSESDGGGSRSWSRSRALSLAANSSPLQQASPLDSVSMFPEEILLDYVEITSIPPLPLFTLLAADKETSQTSRQSVVGKPPTSAQDSKDYSDLFDIPVNPAEENLDEYLDKKFPATSERKRHTSAGSKDQSLLTHFGPKQALLLTKLLTHSHLPGLSSLDQMHLLALADTVASFSTALSDRLDSERPAAVKGATASNSGGLAIQVTTDSLDDCGLRFLLSMRHYTYLLRCLPFVQRAQLQQQGLGAHSLVWAFHSETQEELIQLLPCVQRGNPKWPELRELGIGWWIRSNAVLRRLIEKASYFPLYMVQAMKIMVAKSAFQANNNPMDAALFYLAMKKKNLLWGLFRSIHDTKMTTFFQNNFTQDKWKKSALKNAFALLGKQRFAHAAAFFLLAGNVTDAVEVCLNKLDDLQLALVIVRCYESDLETNICTPNYLKLLYQEILGRDEDGSNYSPSSCHPDPFLRSMAYWMVKDTEEALNTLLESELGQSHPKATEDDSKYQSKDIIGQESIKALHHL